MRDLKGEGLRVKRMGSEDRRGRGRGVSGRNRRGMLYWWKEKVGNRETTETTQKKRILNRDGLQEFL